MEGQGVVVKAVKIAVGRGRVLNLHVVLFWVRCLGGIGFSCLLSTRGSGRERLLIGGRGVMISRTSSWLRLFDRVQGDGGLPVK